MKLALSPKWIRVGLVVGALALAGGGYALLRYTLWPAYRSWSIARMNTMAARFIAENDPRNALLTVRKVLGKRPNNAEAWRLGTKAADMRSSGEAVLFQQRLCRFENTTANQLELIRLALKYGAYSTGLEAIKSAAVEAKDRPEYHRLAAETYRKVRRDLAAKYHLMSLLALEPKDRAASLALAEVEFAADRNHLPADWAQRVEKLAGETDSELPATVLLLRAAVARRAASEAAEIALRLLPRVDLDLPARLSVIEAFFLSDPPAAERMLVTLQNQKTSRPDEVVQIMEFLLEHGKYPAMQNWYAALPETARQDERIKLVTAQALLAVHDWAGLEKILRGSRWSKDEPLRLGLLAHAYRMSGRERDFSETWKQAVGATGQDARMVMTLLRNVEQWRWNEERYDLLWKLFNLMPAVGSVQDLLVAHEYRNGNTVNLNKIYARIIEANPSDENARNNFAYTSLLLGTNENRARQIARELVLKHPGNVSYLTTHTLALHKQGKSSEAFNLVENLGSTEKTVPATMLHEALYAAAVGRTELAGRLLKDLAPDSLLPEERKLVDEAKFVMARREISEGRPSRIATLDTAVPVTSGWLAMLPVRKEPVPADLKQADAYYREGNHAALQELLRGTRWTADEHLRYALLAFAERGQKHESTAVGYWRQAFASAGRDLPRLRDLQALTTRWNWPAERIAVLDRVFENEASNEVLLEELLQYYRQKARTPELARLYSQYVERTRSNGTEAAWCVYYNLLCGLNVTFAQTLAERIHTASPQDPRCRLAYAFSLWRQQRPTEAWRVLQDIESQELAGMQARLVAAGVLIDLGRVDDARVQLGSFSRENALPEEIALAETLSRKIGLGNATIVTSLK